jgi:hypothetical protein
MIYGHGRTIGVLLKNVRVFHDGRFCQIKDTGTSLPSHGERNQTAKYRTFYPYVLSRGNPRRIKENMASNEEGIKFNLVSHAGQKLVKHAKCDILAKSCGPQQSKSKKNWKKTQRLNSY